MLLPLLVLAGVFEAVFALHTGVERVGRYVQVFFEEANERNWEHTAMAFGQPFRGGGPDPLFALYFWLAAVLNLIPAALSGPTQVEWVALGVGHVIFVVHVWRSTRRAARQRAIDLERFTRMKSGA
jgi:hypothetical protein